MSAMHSVKGILFGVEDPLALSLPDRQRKKGITTNCKELAEKGATSGHSLHTTDSEALGRAGRGG